jgi:spore coat polysaccharide biosynthesis predicted glycosyltransferase SpsG
MRKNILVCPLEWGLGHAGRMIPLIDKLIAKNHNIIIGTGKDHMNFFKHEFPEISCIYFPGFKIKYSRYLPQYIIIILKIPSFIFHRIREHLRLNKIIENYKTDIVISDSRTGLWNTRTKTVLVTHMPGIPYPGSLRFLEKTILPLARKTISRFSYCYIPDLPEELNLSGKLSHHLRLPSNVRYIGLLSRFTTVRGNIVTQGKKYYCAVLLSGPEPQKEMLKKMLIRILEMTDRPSVILEAKPEGESHSEERGNLTYINHLRTDEMLSLILESENIITRSGYTTLMELISLKTSALIIPTPGQPEQEYLAEYMKERGWFKVAQQREKEIADSLPVTGSGIPGDLISKSAGLLETALSELLED